MPDSTREKDLSVVVVAGGSGTRMGGETPKQFLLLHGRPILLWSLAALAGHPAVAEIVTVLPAEWLERGREMLAQWPLPLPVTVVAGGAHRQDSVWAGLQGLTIRSRWVAVHDAARPGLDRELIDRLLETARTRGNAVPGVSPADTLVRTRDGRIADRLDRREVMGLQTPQIFPLTLLETAILRARERQVADTDESGLVARLGETVHLVPGTSRNRKITSPEDLQIVAALIYNREEVR